MKSREIFAWGLALLGLIGTVGSCIIVLEERELCDAEKLEAGEMLFECGTALEERTDICSEEGKAYMERGNLIFKCTLEICEKNGWMPPSTWEEDKREIERMRKER